MLPKNSKVPWVLSHSFINSSINCTGGPQIPAQTEIKNTSPGRRKIKIWKGVKKPGQKKLQKQNEVKQQQTNLPSPCKEDTTEVQREKLTDYGQSSVKCKGTN
ncbi:unnamed protein product [Natator depressus]